MSQFLVIKDFIFRWTRKLAQRLKRKRPRGIETPCGWLLLSYQWCDLNTSASSTSKLVPLSSLKRRRSLNSFSSNSTSVPNVTG